MLLTWDILLSGLILGGMYALIAMGLTLQYGVARIMNLSYGEILIAAAFVAFWLYSSMSVSPLIGLIVVIPAAFVFNWAIYRSLLTPLVKRAKNRDMLEVDSILATFGLLFVIQGVMLVVFGGQYYSYFLSVDPAAHLRQHRPAEPAARARFSLLSSRSSSISRSRAPAPAPRSGRSRSIRSRRNCRRSTCGRRRPSPSRSAARWWRPAAC